MQLSKLIALLIAFQAFSMVPSTQSSPSKRLFAAYIGAMFKNITFSEVPISPCVDFHFILSFAIDYTSLISPAPTNGQFNIFWDTHNLSPSQVRSIKSRHGNVKVALSLGGDSVGNSSVYFVPSSIDSWVENAVVSLTKIIRLYDLDGIDIDYEHFNTDPHIFAECIGRLVCTLKENGIISFASIAPYADLEVHRQYLALWKKYGYMIDYVNFQFYGYAPNTTESQFLNYFEEQCSNYHGGKVLVSYISDGSKGLSPGKRFFDACSRLKKQEKLQGIFFWCADNSKANHFQYERQSQKLLAAAECI